jgi:hypothetical protein
LEREARLPGSPGARDRHETGPVRQLSDELGELAFPPYERTGCDRQVRRIERAERRKVPVAELVEPLGPDEVLQPVLPEVADGCVVEKLLRRLGEDDLAPVSSGSDSRSAVYVDPDVALVGDDGLAGVNSHAHAHRAFRESAAGLVRGRHSVGSAREGHEESVTLGVDLDA